VAKRGVVLVARNGLRGGKWRVVGCIVALCMVALGSRGKPRRRRRGMVDGEVSVGVRVGCRGPGEEDGR
jgi:hypothetical protein